MNYIYKYHNNKNCKNYIGQTNNLERRIREHRSVAFNSHSGNYHDYFHQALRKDTEKVFDIEILYQGNCSQEELDELEKKYIKQYHSHVSEGGYNLTWGGHQYKKNSKYIDNANDIKDAIKSGKSYKEISEEFDCSASFISSINHGLRFFDPEEQYPLNTFHYFNADDIYPQMVAMLQDPRYRFQDIAEKLNCSYATVKAFNNGNLQKKKYWIGNYPIRDRYFCDKSRWFQALELMQTTNLPLRVIGREICNISDTVMTKLNRGELLHQDNINYPIRK